MPAQIKPVTVDIDRPPHKTITAVPRDRHSDLVLGAEDLDTIAYELKFASIFCEEPLKVDVPEIEQSVSVGMGLGGLSWSLYVRSPKCTACGRCCNRMFRRTHWWFADDRKPDGLRETTVIVNGQDVKAYYWIQESQVPCDLLRPIHIDGVQAKEENGLLMYGCSLHDVEGSAEQQIKPVHCMSDPQTNVVKVKSTKGTRLVLSRRHYPRNWKWPQCPVSLDVKPDLKTFVADRVIWNKQIARWESVPAVRIHDGYKVWSRTVKSILQDEAPPKDTVYFEDVF